jgi:hypothetical protein
MKKKKKKKATICFFAYLDGGAQRSSDALDELDLFFLQQILVFELPDRLRLERAVLANNLDKNTENKHSPTPKQREQQRTKKEKKKKKKKKKFKKKYRVLVFPFDERNVVVLHGTHVTRPSTRRKNLKAEP